MEALAYVRRMRRMNLTGKSASAHMAPAASVGDGISAAWGLNWADKTFGQGLWSLTKGGPTALCNVMFNFLMVLCSGWLKVAAEIIVVDVPRHLQ